MKSAATGSALECVENPEGEVWPGTESNCRHEDFQSSALPTELPGRTEVCSSLDEWVVLARELQ